MGKFYAGLEAELVGYVRQLAWLESAPKPKPKRIQGPRQYEKNEVDRLSRAENIRLNGDDPFLPDVDCVQYVVDYWNAVGRCLYGGFGAVPLTPSEVLAWSAGSRRPLSAWEFETVLKMSREYVAQQKASENEDCQEPCGDSGYKQVAITNRLKSTFKRLKGTV